MIVVSDTTPLNYLILIEADHILPTMFGRVVTSSVVLEEMKHDKAPSKVQNWASNPPPWLEIHQSDSIVSIEDLGPGESAAIALAQQLNAEILLMDERDGIAVARKLGLAVAGTLGIIERAAENGLIQLSVTIEALRQTTFHAAEKLYLDMLERDRQRNNR